MVLYEGDPPVELGPYGERRMPSRLLNDERNVLRFDHEIGEDVRASELGSGGLIPGPGWVAQHVLGGGLSTGYVWVPCDDHDRIVDVGILDFGLGLDFSC